ncbi:hypothetical protein F4861DRAFT_124015 [Xylaria intraflava]|nr:hypothetical protein F4861DRAFT_124015 [Xylaria intraflava]
MAYGTKTKTETKNRNEKAAPMLHLRPSWPARRDGSYSDCPRAKESPNRTRRDSLHFAFETQIFIVAIIAASGVHSMRWAALLSAAAHPQSPKLSTLNVPFFLFFVFHFTPILTNQSSCMPTPISRPPVSRILSPVVARRCLRHGDPIWEEWIRCAVPVALSLVLIPRSDCSVRGGGRATPE